MQKHEWLASYASSVVCCKAPNHEETNINKMRTQNARLLVIAPSTVTSGSFAYRNTDVY